MRIAQNTFLVSGGGSGLGAASARMVAANGGNIIIADRDKARGSEVAHELGKCALFVETDVTDEASVQDCIRAGTERFGTIRAAVNCAGIAPAERVVGKSGPHVLANFRRTIEVNLVGTFNVLRLAAHAMSTLEPLASGERGVIVNTSSVAAFHGQVGQAAYAASKAGVIGMTLPIAREFAQLGIRVMAIAPGIFDTAMMQGMNPDLRASLTQQIVFPPRFGKPEEFAALVKHIVENEYLNGDVIRLDAAVRMGAT